MASTNTLIKNARLINEGEIRDADVLIDGERIARVDSNIAAGDGVTVIDADGKYLMPGMIDDQVHFREPGLTAKGDLATESAAAAAGGITSFMDMPNVNPLTVTRDKLAEKYELAAGLCTGNYGFYFGATNGNIEEIRITEHFARVASQVLIDPIRGVEPRCPTSTQSLRDGE